MSNRDIHESVRQALRGAMFFRNVEGVTRRKLWDLLFVKDPAARMRRMRELVTQSYCPLRPDGTFDE